MHFFEGIFETLRFLKNWARIVKSELILCSLGVIDCRSALLFLGIADQQLFMCGLFLLSKHLTQKFQILPIKISGEPVILIQNRRLARNFEWGPRKLHFGGIRNFWDFGSAIGSSEKRQHSEKC